MAKQRIMEKLDVYVIEKQWKVVLQIRITMVYFVYCLLKATEPVLPEAFLFLLLLSIEEEINIVYC